MTNFRITFLYPWLLLLIAPALIVTLFLHLRLKARYRRTRTRIISLVLHLVISVLCTLTASGIVFAYDKPNYDNELIILMDVSQSALRAPTALGSGLDREYNFVESVIAENESKDSRYKVGIVLFGKNQVVASELSHDMEEVKRQFYQSVTASTVDDRGTDISAALNFAEQMFSKDGSSRIVLLSNGLETDGVASATAFALASKGISIDTVHFDHQSGPDVLIRGIEFQDTTIIENQEFDLTISMESTFTGEADVVISDNDKELTYPYNFTKGINKLKVKHTFNSGGLQRVTANIYRKDFPDRISPDGDSLAQNNSFHSYYYLTIFNKIMIVDGSDQSDALAELLKNVKNEKNEEFYEIEVVRPADLPLSINELREFDQLIFMNIANADLPAGFDKVLDYYVREHGGGLLTIGGDRAYQYPDMYSNVVDGSASPTLFQQMLPVDVRPFTPSVGVAIVIDSSGSMDMAVPGDTYGRSRLEVAKEVAREIVNTLQPKDYVGVITFGTEAVPVLNLVPQANSQEIIGLINQIQIGGGTSYIPALSSMSIALNSVQHLVQLKHAVIISDGGPSEDLETILADVEKVRAQNIFVQTMLVTSNPGTPSYETEYNIMSEIARVGGGEIVAINQNPNWASDVRSNIRKMPTMPVPGTVNPQISTLMAMKLGITTQGMPISGVFVTGIMPSLGIYYSSRAREESQVLLTADSPITYIPIYAQWQWGNGRVGSFMSDLNGGDTSQTFLSHSHGIKFILEIIRELFPTKDLRPYEIDYRIVHDNFSARFSIITPMADGDTVTLEITDPLNNKKQVKPSASGGWTMSNIEFDTPGVYEILIVKKDRLSNEIARRTVYTSFSYSKEFDVFIDPQLGVTLLETIALNGEGEVVSSKEPWLVYANFLPSFSVEVDPRISFMIMVIIMFLLDVAVRKFKFKWPWEIVRDHKAKKLLKGDASAHAAAKS